MELQTFQFHAKDNRWTVKEFPKLDSKNTLVLIFAAPEFINNPASIIILSKHYPTSKIIGCSTAGEICGGTISDNSLSVAVLKFTKTNIVIHKEKITAMENSYETGEALATKFDQENLRGMLVLSEGLGINGSELVKGLNSVLTDDVIVTGGLAGDGSDFKQTWVIFDGKIIKDHVVAVGLYGGHVQISHGSKGGWDIFGPQRLITRSDNNVLYELDNKPALELYKTYLGDKAAGLPATGLLFPLAIREHSTDTKQLVRTILGVDEKTNSLTFAGDVPTGYYAQLMRANFDRLITGASEASQMALCGKPDSKKGEAPQLLIAISCVGRRLLLGERTEEETEVTLDAFPKNTQQVGYYSYGEISPFTTGRCDLHNQTMTLTCISEGI